MDPPAAFAASDGIAARGSSSLHMVSIDGGEFMGWQTWTLQGPYEVYSGPYAFTVEPAGIRCAFRVEGRHLNGGGTVHGGCLMSFADFALAAIAAPAINDRAVTVSLSCDMLEPVHLGQRVEATGQIVRSGRLIFAHGLATVDSRPIMSFNGIMRNLSPSR